MKKTHFLLVHNTSNISSLFPDAHIGIIDGKKSGTLKDFLEQLALALQFPDSSGGNLDAMDEMLNDLDWIKQPKVVIYIKNSVDWLAKEKALDKTLTTIDILDATAEDWKWLDEEDQLSKKELKIVFESSSRIQTLLDEEEIPYGEL